MRVWQTYVRQECRTPKDWGKSVGHKCPFSSPAVQTPPRSGFHSISGQLICTCADPTSNGFSTTPGGCLWGPQPSLDKTAPSSRPRPSLFRSFPLIHSTHTHTHTHTPPLPHQSRWASQLWRSLLPWSFNSLNQTPSRGFYNLPDVSFSGVTAVPDSVCVSVVKMLWSILPAEQSMCAFCPPLNCQHSVRARVQSWIRCLWN